MSLKTHNLFVVVWDKRSYLWKLSKVASFVPNYHKFSLSKAQTRIWSTTSPIPNKLQKNIQTNRVWNLKRMWALNSKHAYFKYYVIKKVGGWGQEMAIFDDLKGILESFLSSDRQIHFMGIIWQSWLLWINSFCFF